VPHFVQPASKPYRQRQLQFPASLNRADYAAIVAIAIDFLLYQKAITKG
jgi:hypothetical protein